jgi:hypothetical protein
MNLLTQLTKKKALIYFILFYTLSIILIVLLAYFFFRSPTKILVSELQELGEYRKQHETLENMIATATVELSELVAIEQVMSSNPDPALDSISNKHKETLNKVVSSLKADSAKQLLSLHRIDIANYLAAYEAIIFYCENNLKLRKQKLTTRSTVSSGEEARPGLMTVKLRSDNANLKYVNVRFKQVKSEADSNMKLWSHAK